MSQETPSAPTPGSGEPELVDRRRGRARRRWITAAVAVVVLAVVAVGGARLLRGAGGGSGDQAAGTQPSSSNAKVTVGLTLEPSNLDIRTTSGVALDQVLIDNVYEGLVSRTPSGKITPSLAAKWSVSSDALTYTFTLKSGERFSNGHALTAQTVADNLKEVAASQYVDAATLGSVADVTAPDPTTVVVKLKKPNPDLLWALGGRAGLVLDPAAKNDRKTSAVGSGPFLVSKWKQGDSLTLARNPRYWGAPVKVGTIVFRYITDTNAAVNALNSGDLDVLAPINADLRDQVADKSTKLVVGDATDKFVLAFNNTAKPFTDIRVRQALRYAIDHQALIKARGGVDGALGGPIAPGDPGYRDLTGLYPYNPAKAKQLLAQAGHAKGLKLVVTIPNIYGTTLTDLLTSQFAKVGVTLTTRSVDFSTWLSDVYQNKDYQLSIVDHAESHDFASWATPGYYFDYANAQVRKLYGQAQTATSPEAEDALLARAAKIVSQDAAADWLLNFRTVTAIRPGIEGFPTDNINARLDLTGLSVRS